MQAIDPATGALHRTYADHSPEEVERRLGLATVAFAEWSRRSFEDRAVVMRRAAALLRERRDALAELMASEMGKPVAQGRSEAEKCALACDFFAEHAGRFLADEAVKTEAANSFVAFRPLGVVLAVMPWNFPFWQVFRFAAPALMAGNVAVLKHAANVPGCALATERLLLDAGFEEGIFQTLLVEQARVASLIADRRIAAVTLTGSTKAGRTVASQAGQALKKVVLELGGSDPYVVLSDADVDQAATISVAARLTNGGQSCIAAKRFIVVRSLLEAFEERFVAGMRRAVVGDPRDLKTEVGPLARVDLRDGLHRQVVESVRRGARLVLGGVLEARPGAWYPPTVLTRVEPGMPAFDEELFGPVGAIISASDDTDAIRLANTTSFGLGAAVFTRDSARGARVARDELEAGACFVNAMVRSDPRLPFGGIKDSGYGRELSVFGIREFVNVKAIWVA
jgi:succinate-semialdehyde dehydrogenase/glutarate-semialdehyde dehydrogenase